MPAFTIDIKIGCGRKPISNNSSEKLARRHCHECSSGAVLRRSATASISSRVVPRPRLKRITPNPTSCVTPIVSSTGDGSVRPEWHAEPVEAATPSNRFNISVPMQLMKETLSVFGRPNVFCDLNVRQRAASATALGR
jgi:hypothetical protein